jgi:hypothetical protein
MAASVLAGLAAADAMADLVDSTELLDVDVDQLAGALSLVAIRRFGRLEPAALPKADPQGTAETVESAIPSTSAISAAVNRSRRSAAIVTTRASGVRPGTRCGAEERSSSPSSPSAR